MSARAVIDLDALLDALADRVAARLGKGQASATTWVDFAGATEAFGVDDRTLRRLVTSGAIESRLVGRKRLIEVASLEQWIRSQPSAPKATSLRPTKASQPKNGVALDEDEEDRRELERAGVKLSKRRAR